MQIEYHAKYSMIKNIFDKNEGVKITPEKCRFLLSSLVFLGFDKSQSGIRMKEDKLKIL